MTSATGGMRSALSQGMGCKYCLIAMLAALFLFLGGLSLDYEQTALKLIQAGEHDYDALKDAFDVIRCLELDGSVEVDGVLIHNKDNFKKAHELALMVRQLSAKAVLNGGGGSMLDLNKRCLLFDAPYNFDAFLRYIEWNRPKEKKFYEPRRKRLKQIADEMQRIADDELDILGISLPPGVGKALANDTPVLTRNGWKNHGDLIVGDEVIGMDGQFKKVIAVHPKCMLDCEVEFTNGEKIVCHENHEWLVHDRPIHDPNKRIHAMETKRIEHRALEGGGEPGHRGHRYNIQLPHKKYVIGEEKELLLDPYTFGVWLGDGVNRNPSICCAKNDRSVIDRVIRNGNPYTWTTVHKTTGVLYFGFGFRKQLQSMGLCHSRRRTPKYIPEVYLTASVRQRLELLAGLLDTDGTLAGSKYQFTTSEDTLRDSFLELIATFGWRGCIKVAPPTTSSSGITARKDHYIISFTPDCEIPCELERKRNKEPHAQRAIAFKSVSRVAPVEGNCITVEGDGMYLIGKTMLPTHNSTMGIFFICWLAGKHPDKPILAGSHSQSFLRGVYDECLRVLEHGGEYLWQDVFPGVRIVDTNAKDMRIDLGEAKRFQTIEMTSVGSNNAGKVRCEQLLYVDDLVSGIDQALSRERLDKLWDQFTVDMLQRRIGNCKTLIIATRWSVHDPIGRLESMNEDNPRARFIRFPALDENDESNFDYENSVGFTTAFYRQQREIMDEVSWKALYMQETVERTGILYSRHELRRYFKLPEQEPDAILAICDTKEQGTDYCVMPVVYQYGADFYVDHFVCDNGRVEVVEEKVAQVLADRVVQSCRIESNRGGTLFAQNVEKRCRELGAPVSITTKWTQTNKATRIEINSSWIRLHCLFKDESLYKDDREYEVAMRQMTSYTVAGKNKNDDVVDVLSMLVDFVTSFSANKVTIMRRPF